MILIFPFFIFLFISLKREGWVDGFSFQFLDIFCSHSHSTSPICTCYAASYYNPSVSSETKAIVNQKETGVLGGSDVLVES